MCSPPKLKSPSITIYPTNPPLTPFPSGNHHTAVCVYEILFLVGEGGRWLNPFIFLMKLPNTPPLASFSLLSLYESASRLFVSSFCSFYLP